MTKSQKDIKKAWLNKPWLMQKLTQKKALPIIAIIGLALTITIIKLQPKMAHSNIERPSVLVNYIEVQQQPIRPEVIGFGTVTPDLDLHAKAEVTGRIVYIHPSLKKGEIFKKETVLLKIDDKDYLLKVKQAQADLLASKANLTEMQLSIENNVLELQLANEKLKVRKKEYARKQKLTKTGAVSQSNLDAELQNFLQQKQEVLQLKNKQTTLPSQLQVMEAKLEITKASLQKNQRDLARTTITMPFDGRISQVYTQLDQYMPTGTALFDAFGLEKIIINAQFPIDQFSVFASNFNQTAFNPTINSNVNFTKLLAALQLTAIVEDAAGKFTAWHGKVERFSDNLDAKSNTIGVIVSVEDSYKKVQPGSKPPLLQGMYMKVSLQSTPSDFLAIPRAVLHEQTLYKILANNTLKRIVVKKTQYQGELLLLKSITNANDALTDSMIQSGDRIITSDVFPVVDGMSVTPVLDQVVTNKMALWLGVSQ